MSPFWVLTQVAQSLAASDNLSIFDPASENARSIVHLAILTFAIAGLIFCVVEGILFYCLWRFRQRGEEAAGEPPQVYGSMPIELAWTLAPALIVMFLGLVVTRTLWEVKPNTPQPSRQEDALFVTVVGHQWWWEYIYERSDGKPLGFVTANELHVPFRDGATPHRVYLTLKSADVCHSFWVPRLGGKVDAIPGRANTLMLEPRQTGVFLGQCAEYCGLQHANMQIRVTVEPEAAFQEWVRNQSEPAREVASEQEGRHAFLSQSCVNCHRIRGTAANGSYAPDLTHLMSRETLASGMVRNTPDHLAAWIRDPQAIKPGCPMPAFQLTEAQQKSIVRYLLTLH